MERFSIIIYVLFTVILLAMTALVNDTNYQAPASDWFACFKVSFFIALAFWVFARSIDYVFGGPLRRKIKRAKEFQLH